MKVTDPDTGELITLYRSDDYMYEIEAFYDAECLHDGATELRIFTASNGAEHFRHQCLTCGKSVGQSVSKATIVADRLRPFDETLSDRYWAARTNEKSKIIRKHIKIQSEANVRFSKEYIEYLASDRWASKRTKVLERAKYVCEGCGDAKATEVHHLTYSHLFEEFLFELVALCHACHVRWHQDEEIGEDEFAEHEELPCCGCRFQGTNKSGTPWCGVHDLAAIVSLSSENYCGPERKSLEHLK